MENRSIRDFAIDFETKGVNPYLSLAAKTTNPLGKRLFYSLAEQEVQHAALFDSKDLSLPEKSILDNSVKDIEAQLKEFWMQAEKFEIKKEDVHFSGYEQAMEMEKKSISAYKEFLTKSTEEKGKEFLLWIIEEGKKHLEALRNVHYYLTETADWLQTEESRVWNWMNQ